MASKKTIYIVRHGETDYNKQGIVQGSSIDSSINELGQKQANCFWEAYKDVPFNKIYTSKLKRTHQSIQKFIDKGTSWEQMSALNEISWGDYDGTKLTEDNYYWQVVDKWNNGELDYRISGGESPKDVALRQKEFIDKILKEDDDLVLVAMHGRALRILISNYVLNDLNKMDTVSHRNLGLYILEVEEGQISMKFENLTEHLID